MAGALRLRAAALIIDELALGKRVEDRLPVLAIGLDQRRSIAGILGIAQRVDVANSRRRRKRVKLCPAGRSIRWRLRGRR